MSPQQAELWNGKAEEPFDPNYHKTNRHFRPRRSHGAARSTARGVGLRRRALRAGSDAAATACRSARTAPGTWTISDSREPRCGDTGSEPRWRRRVWPARRSSSRADRRVPSPPSRRAISPATWRARSASTACSVHLRKLQEIADANDGTRADGTPGYDASVDYVAKLCGTRVSTFRRRSSSGSASRRPASRR